MKVVCGISGGVDSAVTAYLLKNQGYDVHCVFVRMMDDDSEKADAFATADLLCLPFEVIDFRERFKNCIINDFINEYTKGRTPNPCIVCNRDSKWSAMLEYADLIGADYVATGHYAKIKELENGRYTILNSASAEKDQTYVLCRLTQDMLRRTLMPLGEYTKEEVRRIAGEIGLNVASKPDSQDICFIPDNDHFRFLKENAPDKMHGEGDFINSEGQRIGTHKGIEAYTIGQRKGLNISLGHPVYVSAIDADSNSVTLNDTDVYSDEMTVGNISEMGMRIDEIDSADEFTVRVRYAHRGEAANVYVIPSENKDIAPTLKVKFKKPVRAIAPGQAAVFYIDGCICFAGTIL